MSPRYYPASKTGTLDNHKLGDDFRVSLERFEFDTIELAEKAIRKLILGLYNEIIETSPHDTNLFKANHQIGIGSIPEGTLIADRPVEGKKYDFASENEQQRSKLDSFKLDTMVYICNNLRYSVPLEFGHSSQAPLGVYRKAALKFKTSMGQ
jgi:hypothetical protein